MNAQVERAWDVFEFQNGTLYTQIDDPQGETDRDGHVKRVRRHRWLPRGSYPRHDPDVVPVMARVTYWGV